MNLLGGTVLARIIALQANCQYGITKYGTNACHAHFVQKRYRSTVCAFPETAFLGTVFFRIDSCVPLKWYFMVHHL